MSDSKTKRGVVSGVELALDIAHWWRLRDGLVVRVRAYTQADEALAAAGLVQTRTGLSPPRSRAAKIERRPSAHGTLVSRPRRLSLMRSRRYQLAR